MPSGHSSSSHSSHSSSSHSSHSSSRSFSSGSSRSYSSSSSRGPSSHSSSSWSSRPSSSSSYSYGKSSSKPVPRPAPQPTRPRVNQPTGFRPFGGMAPRYVYGRRHDYIYYPVAWVDSATGQSYEKGYYDENGQRYDDVSFNTDGKYKNVVCHCNYCDRDAIIDLSKEDAEGKDLQCPSCGAPMVVNSFLDDYLTGTDGQTASADDTRAADRSRSRNKGCLLAIVLFLAIGIISCVALGAQDTPVVSGTNTQQIVSVADASNVDIFGEQIYLTAGSDGGYSIGETSSNPDKMLVWDDGEECYYDEASDCWLWYNTNMDPPVWQYWYEGISSDYGDYGWMEHDETGWYIEADYGDWIELPQKYNPDALWYIEE